MVLNTSNYLLWVYFLNYEGNWVHIVSPLCDSKLHEEKYKLLIKYY